jgi:hypothetical protein
MNWRKRKMSMHKRIGIPIEKVGERIRQLNEAIKANNMVIKADNKIEIDINSSRNDTALAVTMTVYLFDEEENKENEQKAGE